MSRAIWLLWLVAPLYCQKICVESLLSTNNDAVLQNKSAVEALAQILIDDVFKANDVRYYDYVANGATRTDCAHIVFLFDKPDAGEWVVRAKIDRTYALALNGSAIIERCALGITKPGKLEDFEWRKAVQDNVMHCFGDAFRLQEKKDLLYKYALVARNVQDRCNEGVNNTPSCLVLPLPFAPPFNRLAKASFRIVSPYEYGGEFDVNGSARGQCARFSDQTERDLSRIKADLDGLAPVLAMLDTTPERDEAQKRLAEVTQIVAAVGADPAKLSGVPAALATVVTSLRQLRPVPEAAGRLEKDGWRLEANSSIKPIDKAIVVNLERSDIDMADWAFSRVEILRVDDNIPDCNPEPAVKQGAPAPCRCDPWREPPVKKILLPAPPKAPPGGQN
jgi:hypothetical protein